MSSSDSSDGCHQPKTAGSDPVRVSSVGRMAEPNATREARFTQRGNARPRLKLRDTKTASVYIVVV